MTTTQWCLAQGNEIQLSKDEHAYLAWAEKQKTQEKQVIDIPALKEIGLSDKEISFLQIIGDANKMYGAPANCGLVDTSRYLLWGIEHFPKTDKTTGRITVQSFLNSTSPSYLPSKGDIKKEDYFLSIRWTVKHAIDGNYPDTALLRIYKKVLGWCLDFEKEHGLKEKGFEAITLDSESVDENEPENPEQTQEKDISAEDIQDFEPEGMTAKQKDYLLYLMSTTKDDRIRQEIQKRMCVLSKLQARGIISLLVSGNEEGVFELI